MKKYFSNILLFVFSTLLSSAVFAEPLVYEVSGVISDKKTGENIKQAQIQIERNGEIIQQTTTKADGTFVLRLSETNNTMPDKIKVRVLKRGYKSQTFNTIPGSDAHLHVQLEKLKAIPIMVPKKSSTGQYIIVHNTTQYELSLDTITRIAV